MNSGKRFLSVWEDPGPDKGWSWVIMFTIWTTFFIIMGPLRSSGVFYSAMMISMDLTAEEASWPFSLCNGVSGFSGLVGGYLTVHFSCRQITMGSSIIATIAFVLCYALPPNIHWITAAYGMMFGIAHGMTLPILQMILNEYFESFRTTATGISLTGVSVVGLVAPIMAKYIIEQYDIRGCFLILASLVAQMCVVSSLMRPRCPKQFPSLGERRTLKLLKSENMQGDNLVKYPSDKTKSSSTFVTPESYEQGCLKSNPADSVTGVELPKWWKCFLNVILPSQFKDLLGKPLFLLLCFSSAIVHVTYFTYLSFAVAHGISNGFSLYVSTLFVSCYSSGEFIARFVVGQIVDRNIFSATFMFAMCVLFAGVSLIVFGFATNNVLAFISAFSFGFATGGYVPLRGTLLAQLFGVKYTAFGIGFIHSFCGLLFLTMPKLIGCLTEKDNHFGKVCYVLGGACVIAGITWFVGSKLIKK